VQIRSVRVHINCLLAILALLATACSRSSDPYARPSDVRVVVRALGGSAQITSMTLTVTKGDGSDFSPIVTNLTESSGQWSRRISVPAGAGRLFTVIAYDQGGNAIYTGSGKSDVVAGAVTIVSILLNTNSPLLKNSLPVIDSLAASPTRVLPNGHSHVAVGAHDPDPGDTIAYHWEAAAGCGSFDDPTKADPQWTAPGTEKTCQLSVTVSDSHGAATTAVLAVFVTNSAGDVEVNVNTLPVISSFTGNVTLGSAMTGDLSVTAVDPDGDPLSYEWTSTCAGIASFTTDNDTQFHFSMPGPSTSCSVTVRVSDHPATMPSGTTTATLVLPPNPGFGMCAGVTCQTGQTCDPVDGVCKSLCASVTCPPASDACHVAGTCNPATGVCSTETAKSCPSGQSCDLADGQCKAPPTCVTTGCPPASDNCHLAGTCNTGTGVCSAETAKSCPTGQSCDLADGQCKAPASCVTAGCPPASDNCHLAGTCNTGTGVCSAETAKSCGTGQTCDLADGQCKGSAVKVPQPVAAKSLDLSFGGMAIDVAGALYVSGSVYLPTKVFDTFNVTSAGDGDVLLAKYDPVSHTALQVKNFGDAGAQSSNGVAVANQGASERVAVIGQLSGTLAMGNSVNDALAYPINFLAVTDASLTPISVQAFDLGSNGNLLSVAGNVNSRLVAVCGYTNQAATQLVPGATFKGGARDVAIAAYDVSTNPPTFKWAKQLGDTSAGNSSDEECDAVAVDDAGNVWAVGKYGSTAGASNFNLTGTAFATTPPSGARWIWVAGFNGQNGTPLAQANFGAGAGTKTPTAIALDAAGNVLIAGNFGGSLPFGATALATAGSSDGFVAKLSPTLAPVWAVRLGGTGSDTANAVAATSTGDVLASGFFNGTATNADGHSAVPVTPPFTSAGAADVFLLKLDGATGATQFSAHYGDSFTQSGDKLAVDRWGMGSSLDLVGLGGTLNGSMDFGTGALTAPGSTSMGYIVFAQLQ
jgi:hypothetical protein